MSRRDHLKRFAQYTAKDAAAFVLGKLIHAGAITMMDTDCWEILEEAEKRGAKMLDDHQELTAIIVGEPNVSSLGDT